MILSLLFNFHTYRRKCKGLRWRQAGPGFLISHLHYKQDWIFITIDQIAAAPPNHPQLLELLDLPQTSLCTKIFSFWQISCSASFNLLKSLHHFYLIGAIFGRPKIWRKMVLSLLFTTFQVLFMSVFLIKLSYKASSCYCSLALRSRLTPHRLTSVQLRLWRWQGGFYVLTRSSCDNKCPLDYNSAMLITRSMY